MLADTGTCLNCTNGGITVLSGFSGLARRTPAAEFQQNCNNSQAAEDDDISIPPSVIRIQDAEASEHIVDAQQNYYVAYRVVVCVPVEPILVLFLRPHK